MQVLFYSASGDAAALTDGLRSAGIRVDRADPAMPLETIADQANACDAVLLAVPQLRGPACLAVADLRRRGLRLPVIVLCPSATPEEASEASDLGADEVLARNVGATVLAARLRAAHRRCRNQPVVLLSCGNVTLEQGRRLVFVDGEPVRLTDCEFELLEMLMLRRGMVQTKEHLMDRLYANAAAPRHRILDVFICKLRRKLAAAGAMEIIRTVWGQGYVVEDAPGLAALTRHPARHRPWNGLPAAIPQPAFS